MITASIDTAGASAVLNGLREAMIGKGMDASHVVEDEVKQLSRAIVNFTPPLGPGGRSAGARQAGEQAIERENKNLISEAKPGFLSMVSERWGIKDVTGYIEQKHFLSKAKIQLKFGNIDSTGQQLANLHNSYRNRRGKIPLQRQPEGTWTSRVLTVQGARDPFIAILKERVGMWKATWAFGASKLGGRFPKWIARHFGQVSGLAVADFRHLKDPVRPYAIIGSRFPGGFARMQFVKDAVKSRVRNLRLKMRHILSDYKTAAQKGVPIEPAARKRPEHEVTVE